jgi:hypothetical protein
VPVFINIVARLETSQIAISAKNLEKFGESTYIFDLDEFGKDVMEELAKIIIAKPSKLRTMGRHQRASSLR